MVAVIDPGLLRLMPRRRGIVTENLQLHLDAGNSDSYPGTGQPWLDLTANSLDLVRGLSASGETQDPAFNGTAGGMSASEHFSSDGNDQFVCGAAYSGSILRTLGRTDRPYTVEMVIYKAAGDGMLFSNQVQNGSAGMTLRLDYPSGGDAETLTVLDGSSSVVAYSGAELTNGSWHWVALKGKWDGTAPNTIWIDGAQSGSSYAKTGNFGSGDSAYAATLWCRADGEVRIPSGSRIAIVRMYDVELAEADLLRNWSATRKRFGI